MEKIIFTLHDYMLHTESITYLLMAVSLFAILGFWFYLTEKDEE